MSYALCLLGYVVGNPVRIIKYEIREMILMILTCCKIIIQPHSYIRMRVFFRLTDKPGREDAGEDPPATGGQKSVPDSGSIVYSRHKSVVLTQKGWKTVSFGVSCRL